jgi:hypothetical protein
MRIAEEHKIPLYLASMAMVMVVLNWTSGAKYAADETDSVHHQMQQILNEEVPSDVTRIAFDAVGVRQDCILSDKGHDESAAVPDAPHQAHILGQLARKGDDWRSMEPGGHMWVRTFQAHKERVDAAAISEPDFRALVRQCVAAVRQQRHRAPTWTLTENENRASWSVGQEK